MRCPACRHPHDRVVDSRAVHGGTAIRRRRECEQCARRFTTYERIEEPMPIIVKRDGRREPYNRDKLLHGLHIACRKRPVSNDQIEALADEVEALLIEAGKDEVSSREVGDYVMQGLSRLDAVAYVRFASVYQSFEDVASFTKLLDSLQPTTLTPAEPLPSVALDDLASDQPERAARLGDPDRED